MKVAVIRLSLAALFLVSSTAFGAQRATLTEDMRIYRSPDTSSEVLGVYRKGTVIQVGDRDQGGWFALGFSRPVKGATQGWVQKEKLQLSAAPASRGAVAQRRASRAPGQPHTYSLGPMARMYLFNPALYATASQVASASGAAPVFGLQFGYLASRDLEINLNLMLFSLTKTIDGAAATGFYASGPIGVLGLDYYFARSGGFDFSIGGGIGATMAKVGMYNPDTGSKVETSSISGILLMGKLSVGKQLGSSVGLKLDAGYQMLNLKDVPFLILADQNGTADFSMTAPFFGLSLLYLF